MEHFSQAADNNKAPILELLRTLLPQNGSVLEVGSGSGQHAIYFSAEMSGLRWQPSERPSMLSTLTRNIETYGGANVLLPVTLDLEENVWPAQSFDAVYSANVLHIVSVELGAKLIAGAGQVLKVGGLLICYGPFKYNGNFTTSSNEVFDASLKARDSDSGIRDFEWVCDHARRAGFALIQDQPMPANNQCLVFRRVPEGSVAQ
jgi:SAM-dependent methyltransferase